MRTDLAIAFGSQFFYKIIGYAVLFLLVRYLTKDEMGEFFFAASLAGTAILFTELGLGPHLVRLAGAEPEHVEHRLADVLSIRLPLLAIYFVVLNAGVALVRPALLETSIFASTYVGLLGLYSTFGALFIGTGRVKWNATVGVTSQLLLVGLVWTAMHAGIGLRGVLIAHIAANTMQVALALWKARPWLERVRLRLPGVATRRVLRGALPLFLVALLQTLHFKIDTVMLGVLKPYEQVAAYEAGSRLLEASQFVLRPLSMIFLPLWAGLAAQGAWDELRSAARKMIGGVGALGAAIALGVAVLAGAVVPMVFGGDYASTIPILRVLYLSVPGLYVGSASLLLLAATGRESEGARVLCAGVMLNVLLNVFAIPRWGAAGAAWATLASQTLTGAWLIGTTARALARTERAGAALTPEASHVT